MEIALKHLEETAGDNTAFALTINIVFVLDGQMQEQRMLR
jgi:hypothetical protein